MNDPHREPRREQECGEGLPRSPQVAVYSVALQREVRSARRYLRRCEPAHDRRGDIEGRAREHYVLGPWQGVSEDVGVSYLDVRSIPKPHP